jgi:hypothetical protein
MCTAHIIANVCHALLYECAIYVMQNKFKLSSDSGNRGTKKCKQGYVGVWRSLHLAAEVWRQAVGFIFMHFTGIWLWLL